MSGVYIKGMEMPTSCARCPMLEGDGLDGLCHAASKWLDDDKYWTWYVYPEGDIDDSKPCNCPLIAVPNHGDLIDRNALVPDTSFYDGGDWHYGYSKKTIQYAPTVLPADKEAPT